MSPGSNVVAPEDTLCYSIPAQHMEDLEQQMANISLAALAQVYNLDFHEAHHILEDALVTARVRKKRSRGWRG